MSRWRLQCSLTEGEGLVLLGCGSGRARAPRGWAAPLKPINAPRTLFTPITLAYLEPPKTLLTSLRFNLTTALWQLTDLPRLTDL